MKILKMNKEGQITQKTMAEQMSWLKCSLIEALYPGIQLARVQVPLEPLDSFQQALVEQALGSLPWMGKPTVWWSFRLSQRREVLCGRGQPREEDFRALAALA